jgi:hypothetical protein
MMKTDTQTRQNLTVELRSSPGVNETDVPAAAQDGVDHQGHIGLEVALERDFDPARADSALRGWRDLLGVGSAISVKRRVAPADSKRRIDAASRRSACGARAPHGMRA